MLIEFFDCDGVVQHEYVPQGQTVNQHFYIDVLRRFTDVARPEKWQSGNSLFIMIALSFVG